MHNAVAGKSVGEVKIVENIFSDVGFPAELVLGRSQKTFSML